VRCYRCSRKSCSRPEKACPGSHASRVFRLSAGMCALPPVTLDLAYDRPRTSAIHRRNDRSSAALRYPRTPLYSGLQRLYPRVTSGTLTLTGMQSAVYPSLQQTSGSRPEIGLMYRLVDRAMCCGRWTMSRGRPSNLPTQRPGWSFSPAWPLAWESSSSTV
jgi:hypothetical protein